jgi:dUTP pyrophosphatase
MVIARYERIKWNLVDELTESERGEGGFGSTGKK